MKYPGHIIYMYIYIYVYIYVYTYICIYIYRTILSNIETGTD